MLRYIATNKLFQAAHKILDMSESRGVAFSLVAKPESPRCGLMKGMCCRGETGVNETASLRHLKSYDKRRDKEHLLSPFQVCSYNC